MPLYEYQCKECGHVFEREHAIGEKKKFKCPDCSCAKTQKIISQVGVIFKGSGFYATDNRKGNGSSSSKTSTAKSTKKESCPAKSSDNPACENCPASEN